MRTRLVFLLLILLGGNQIIFGQKSEERKLSAFSEITLRINATLSLAQGDEQKVTVKADQSALDRLVTEVKSRNLIIRYKTESMFSSWNPGPVDISITIPQIDKISLLGSGSITTEGLINTRILELLLSGNGEIRLDNLVSEKVSSVLSGSGNITVSGKQVVQDFSAVLSGSGNIKAGGLVVSDADVKISGSGSCWINVSKNLKARVLGSGNIIYRGNPAIDSAITGSGQVRAE